MSDILRRFRYLLNRGRREEELRSEMEFHREMALREGRALGDTLRFREESRDAWGWTWLDRLSQDLRYALRTFQRSPGFTLAAVLTLALSVGVNVAAFGFFDLFALRSLPVRDPGSILRFQRRSPQSYATHLSYPAIAFYGEHSRSLSAVMAMLSLRLTMEGQDKPIRAHFVTTNYLSELGAPAVLGRVLSPTGDEGAGAEPAVVLSHGFWQRRCGADPGIIGRTIRLNGQAATVIGVAASTFGGLSSGATDVWLPITSQPYFIPGSPLLSEFSGGVAMWGRLGPGVTPGVAEEELRMLTAELRKQHPSDIWEDESLKGEPGAYAINAQGQVSVGSGTPPGGREIYTVAAIAGTLFFLILAVACGNLGGLLLARGAARQREISIRVAVGAGPGRLIRQLFTESLLLALLGSLAGLALGALAVRVLMRLTDAPPWLDPSPDWRIIVFAIGMGLTAAILFGLTPAVQIARQRHGATLLRHVLVGGQVTASCVLLIVASLLVRALDHALNAHPGFEYRRVISVDSRLDEHGYSPEQARVYLDTLGSRLQALPEVESVSLASNPPLGRKATVMSSDVQGRVANVHMNRVDPDFFETMRIPVLRGRTLLSSEPGAIVISESLARRQWPDEDALGKMLPLGDARYSVVGIAGNARAMALQDPDAVEGYLPARIGDLPSMTVLIQTKGAPENVAGSVAALAKATDPRLHPDVSLMQNAFDRKLEDVKRSSLAASLLGSLALLLACFGIVGIVAYAVSQRTREIGIRMALGAPPWQVLTLVLRQFSRPVAFGLLAGVAGAAALSQVLRRQLYGVSHLDPVAYLTAIAVFAVTAALAALVPARRALRVDPLHALRHE